MLPTPSKSERHFAMAVANLPSPDVLRQLLHYEPATGAFVWRHRSISLFPDERAWKIWNTRFAGTRAFASTTTNGYWRGCIFGVRYLGHRVAWAWSYGAWPEQEVDHINGDPLDNRLANLRAVSASTNCRNLPMRKSNTSGHIGVSRRPRGKPWIARIHVGDQHIHLGAFDTVEEAATARKAADARYGFHPDHGRRV